MRSSFKTAFGRFSAYGAAQRTHEDLDNHNHHQDIDSNYLVTKSSEIPTESGIFGTFSCTSPVRAQTENQGSSIPRALPTPSISTVSGLGQPQSNIPWTSNSISTSSSPVGIQGEGASWYNPIDLTTPPQKAALNISNGASHVIPPPPNAFDPGLFSSQYTSTSANGQAGTPDNHYLLSSNPSAFWHPAPLLRVGEYGLFQGPGQIIGPEETWSEADTHDTWPQVPAPTTAAEASNITNNSGLQSPQLFQPSWAEYDDVDEAVENYLREKACQLKKDADLAQQLQLQFNQEAAALEASSQINGSASVFPNPGFFEGYNPWLLPQTNIIATRANEASEMDVDHQDSSQTLSLDASNEDDENEADIPGDERTNLQQLKEYTGSLSSACAGCGKKHSLNQHDIPKITRRWVASTGRIWCALECPGNSFCTTLTCPGCRSAIKPHNDILGSGSTQQPMTYAPASAQIQVGGIAYNVYYCCESGRNFALWALACGSDQPQTRSFRQAMASKLKPRWNPDTSQAASKSAKKASPIKTHIRSTHRDRFIHRTLVAAKGTGYGGSEATSYMGSKMPVGRHRVLKTGSSQVLLDAKEDLVHEAYFRMVSALLPSPSSQGLQATDSSAPAHIYAMLARSPLMARAAALFSNDSIQDISKQRSLYDGALDFINALGSNSVTSGLVYDDRKIYAKWGSTLSVSYSREDGKKVTAKDTSKSLASLLSRLATQGRTLLQHAKQNPQEFEAKSESDMLVWVEKVVRTSALLEVNLCQLKQDAMDIDNDQSKNPVVHDWPHYHEEHAVQELDDQQILRYHHYSGSARTLQGKTPPRGRMKRLIHEISTLKTSLPEGIFIRHGSSRLDVMKILIIGPKGTPYEYGFFEFDMFCPIEYPNVPPHLHFRTTGGGKIRFNPNLYENGKVCLSLLGTWSGEPWQPAKSTILQLLVSVQSMILCENPWYNEPGRELQPNEIRSTAYNNEIRTSTIQYAIYPWVSAVSASMPDPERVSSASSMWRAIAQVHLRLFGREIDQAIKIAAAKSTNNIELDHQAWNIHSALERQGYLV